MPSGGTRQSQSATCCGHSRKPDRGRGGVVPPAHQRISTRVLARIGSLVAASGRAARPFFFWRGLPKLSDLPHFCHSTRRQRALLTTAGKCFGRDKTAVRDCAKLLILGLFGLVSGRSGVQVPLPAPHFGTARIYSRIRRHLHRIRRGADDVSPLHPDRTE